VDGLGSEVARHVARLDFSVATARYLVGEPAKLVVVLVAGGKLPVARLGWLVASIGPLVDWPGSLVAKILRLVTLLDWPSIPVPTPC
jgi:hypothetical protein